MQKKTRENIILSRQSIF